MQQHGIKPSPRQTQPDNTTGNSSVTVFEYSKDDHLLPHQRAALEQQAREQAREQAPQPRQSQQHAAASQPPQSTEEPAAIRSSFVVGKGAPDDDRFVSAKERKRVLWLQELEQQREEQRQRKLKEKANGREEESHWADKFSNYQPKRLPAQDSVAPPQDTAARISSAPVAATDAVAEKTEDATFLRGQNTRIDPVTLKEFEDKRKKEHQHQDFIRQQIEEKARLKRDERERRVRDEIEEEKKLQKERDQTHGLTHRDGAKQKEKEDAEWKRVEVLKQAIEQAQEAAEMEKHQKRVRKLQQGGHDVSNLDAKTPRPPAQFNTGPTVEPTYIPGLEPTSRDFETRNQGYYTENRVLTPTYQRTASTNRKEFGVQTETEDTLVNREETDIEYRGPFNKKVRIKSGPKDGRPKKPVKINERPKWGQQNPVKKRPVKQSAKGPYYEEKKQRSDVMKQERQQAMQRQEARNTVAQRDTVASRSRSYEPKSPMIPKHEDYDLYARDNPRDTYRKSQTPPPSVRIRHRSPSPPVPTIKHMIRESEDQYKQTSSQAAGSKYADIDPALYNNGDFIPFVRTTDLLDPSKADESVPVSREQSAIERGRRIYQQELNPAKYGKRMDNIRDKNESYPKDPILQPNLVTEHPTSRQGQILQQLSSLRRGLMMKQRELEMNEGMLGLA